MNELIGMSALIVGIIFFIGALDYRKDYKKTGAPFRLLMMWVWFMISEIMLITAVFYGLG